MIDVSHYIDKLEVLKEYMNARIDGVGELMTIDYKLIPRYTPDELLALFSVTGWVMWEDANVLTPYTTIMPFEQFYQSKQINK